MYQQKILLDTDIGSDIDDCITLSYLLAQPECELVGITTVTGEPHKRALITDWNYTLAKMLSMKRCPDVALWVKKV